VTLPILSSHEYYFPMKFASCIAVIALACSMSSCKRTSPTSVVVQSAANLAGCTKLSISKSESNPTHIAAVLSDHRINLAGQSLVLLGTIKKNVKVTAVGAAVQLAQSIAEYVNTQEPSQETYMVECLVPTSGEMGQFGPGPIRVIGTSTDVGVLLGTRSPNARLKALLDEYSVDRSGIPSFPQSGLGSTQNYGETQAGPQWGTVFGKVVDQDGNSLPGVIVSLMPSSITQPHPQSRQTRDDGSFEFTDSPENYVISAHAIDSAYGGASRRDERETVIVAGGTSRATLILRPDPQDIADNVTAEQRRLIMTFVINADDAEINALRNDNPRLAAQYYSGQPYQTLAESITENLTRNTFQVSQLDTSQSYIKSIHYDQNRATISVDAIEAWSSSLYDLQTGIRTYTTPTHLVPQTLTIEKTTDGWFITDVQYHRN
jgi:hypothetical protein